MFGILGVGLRFPMSDVGVYESVVDGACGDWKLVNFFVSSC